MGFSDEEEQEYRRHDIVAAAVAAADHEILAGYDGTEEELAFLTAAVAGKFLDKVTGQNRLEMLKRSLLAPDEKAAKKKVGL